MFLRRLSVFDYENNPFYKPKGTFNLHSATDSIQIPNCTQYCFLRMHEASDQTVRQNKWIREAGGFGNAKTWYDTTTLPKGSQIKEGAIAVFDGTCGHVFFVEKKLDETHATVSTESNYNANKKLRNWYFWNKRENVELVVGKATLNGVGKLLGFIYIPINDIRTERNTGKHQIEVTAEMVNVRVAANGDVYQKGLYCPTGIYNVLDTKVIGENTWYKLEENRWIRDGEWLIDYPVKSDILAQINALAKQIASLSE